MDKMWIVDPKRRQIKSKKNMALVVEEAKVFLKIVSAVFVSKVPSIYMNQLLLFISPDLPRQITDDFH